MAASAGRNRVSRAIGALAMLPLKNAATENRSRRFAPGQQLGLKTSAPKSLTRPYVADLSRVSADGQVSGGFE